MGEAGASDGQPADKRNRCQHDDNGHKYARDLISNTLEVVKLTSIASVVALPDTLEKAVKGIPNVDTVIEGHGDVNTWSGFRDYAQFSRALLDAAKAGMGKRTAEEIAADLKPKFPVFTKEELLTDMEYGGTPLSRAVINVNVAFQELAGK